MAVPNEKPPLKLPAVEPEGVADGVVMPTPKAGVVEEGVAGVAMPMPPAEVERGRPNPVQAAGAGEARFWMGLVRPKAKAPAGAAAWPKLKPAVEPAVLPAGAAVWPNPKPALEPVLEAQKLAPVQPRERPPKPLPVKEPVPVEPERERPPKLRPVEPPKPPAEPAWPQWTKMPPEYASAYIRSACRLSPTCSRARTHTHHGPSCRPTTSRVMQLRHTLMELVYAHGSCWRPMKQRRVMCKERNGVGPAYLLARFDGGVV